jgi:hypothetical protein
MNYWKKQSEQRNYSNNKRSTATSKENNEQLKNLSTTIKDLREVVRIYVSIVATKFKETKHQIMVTIREIGKKNATILLDTKKEETNLISTNSKNINGIKSILFDTCIVIRIAIKGFISISAVYVT